MRKRDDYAWLAIMACPLMIYGLALVAALAGCLNPF